MESPPLDARALRLLVRAAESPLTSRSVRALMYKESGIAAMLAVPLEPGDSAPIDDRPLGPAEVRR